MTFLEYFLIYWLGWLSATSWRKREYVYFALWMAMLAWGAIIHVRF